MMVIERGIYIMTSNLFSKLELNDTLVKVTEELFFKEPTEIQTKVIPAILNNKSVIGESQTGSGKTHAFLLPLINQIEEDKNEVQYVIAVPTRELAMQIHADVQDIIKLSDKEDKWTSRLLVGGLDRERMKKQLQNHTPDIIVGTPGRILDMVKDKALSIYTAKSFVIDEADLMLDMGFLDEIDQLLVRCDKSIQTLVFSATIPEKLERFFTKYLLQPEHIKIESPVTPAGIEHKLIELRHRNPVELIENISKIINPLQDLISEINSKATEIAFELLAMLRKVAKSGPIPSMLAADTSVGRTLETVLGIKINSSKQPDYKGIELKSFRSSRTNRKTLFAQVPDWSLSKFKSSAEILNAFGYPRGDSFKLYCTVSTITRNSQGLALRLDSDIKQIIENSEKPEIGDFVVWTLDKLHKRLQEKHKETFWVEAKSTFVDGKEYFQYSLVEHTKKPISSQFDLLVDQGIITLDHLIKRNSHGKVVEKGPLFKIKPKALDLLFPPSEKYNLI